MSRFRRPREMAAFGALFALALASPTHARVPNAPKASNVVVAGATTKGGVADGGTIVHVTNLDDAGAGSLRAALGVAGPVVIVFDVGGPIKLARDLKVSRPFVTIAGQTAPSPGISLWGASLRVRTHDVVIQHIAVRPGPAATTALNNNRDGLSIDGSGATDVRRSYQVRIENVSVSWSVDEGLSLWSPTTRQVTVRHSIVAEALRNAGHGKGVHSMGLLVGTNVQAAEISGNLLVSNMYRNPVAGKGASAIFVNNYIVNPGQNAIHFYGKNSIAPTRATVVNNVIEAGLDTKPSIVAVMVPLGVRAATNDRIFVDGNVAILDPRGKPLAMGTGLPILEAAPVRAATWTLLPTDAVKSDVTALAGSRPADRDKTDRRLIAQIAHGQARVVDTPPETMPTSAPTRQPSLPPADPFGVGAHGRRPIEIWLCERHFAVGGAPSAECPG